MENKNLSPSGSITHRKVIKRLKNRGIYFVFLIPQCPQSRDLQQQQQQQQQQHASVVKNVNKRLKVCVSVIELQ